MPRCSFECWNITQMLFFKEIYVKNKAITVGMSFRVFPALIAEVLVF
jgi:hypothetical protein